MTGLTFALTAAPHVLRSSALQPSQSASGRERLQPVRLLRSLSFLAHSTQRGAWEVKSYLEILRRETATSSGYTLNCSFRHTASPPQPACKLQVRNPNMDTLSTVFFVGLIEDTNIHTDIYENENEKWKRRQLTRSKTLNLCMFLSI